LPQIEVLIDGMAVPTYRHSGTTYLEALKGKEYAIRLTNPTGSRVAVALSDPRAVRIDCDQRVADE
jgi:hypothetical protein